MPKDPTRPRILTADREQGRFLHTSFDELIPEDHRVRDLWRWLESFELTSFYDRIVARGSAPGRPAIDPKILLCLWIFATSEGIGSARQLDRLCERDLVYRWILGGVTVNHHTLSDFRTCYEKELDRLMTEILGVLMHAGVLSLERVSQDGVRVRASAGAASFRREATLKECLEEAKEQVEEVKRQADEFDGTVSKREQKARERAAREKEERIRKSLEELPKVRESKTEKKDEEKARTSTTDPVARVMKMADGGFRPAFNLQFAVDTKSRVLVGVEVSNRGSDYGELAPMVDQIEERTGKRPEEILADGGFADFKDIQACDELGVTVYAPVPRPRKKKGETDEDHAARAEKRYEPKPKDTRAIVDWRERMRTEEAKKIYRERAATIETVNGDLRAHRGLTKLLVRGTRKVRCVALLTAITYNLLRTVSLLESPPK